MAKTKAKDVVLETAALGCGVASKALLLAAFKCEQAEKYCRSQKDGDFKFGFSFTLGDHVHKFGNA